MIKMFLAFIKPYVVLTDKNDKENVVTSLAVSKKEKKDDHVFIEATFVTIERIRNGVTLDVDFVSKGSNTKIFDQQ